MAHRVVRKVSDKAIQARIIRELSQAAEHWGLNMTIALAHEAKAKAMIKAHHALAMTMLKQGHICSYDMA